MFAHTHVQYARGYSMLEGLTILLIVAVILSIGAPPLNSAIDRSRGSSDVRALIASLNLARTTAITSGLVTTYCASEDGRRCSENWQAGTLLFHDNNDNRVLDEGEKLIERGPKIHGQGRLEWRASGGRNHYIRFSRHGMAKEFGTFTYCSLSTSDNSYRRMLILNRAGRARLSKGDGADYNSRC